MRTSLPISPISSPMTSAASGSPPARSRGPDTSSMPQLRRAWSDCIASARACSGFRARCPRPVSTLVFRLRPSRVSGCRPLGVRGELRASARRRWPARQGGMRAGRHRSDCRMATPLLWSVFVAHRLLLGIGVPSSYVHLSTCRRSSRTGIRSAIQGEWGVHQENCAPSRQRQEFRKQLLFYYSQNGGGTIHRDPVERGSHPLRNGAFRGAR